MNKILLGLLIISTLSVSCSKDDDNGGGGAGSDSYMTLDGGKQWVYEISTDGNTEVDTLRSTSRDTTVEARLFRVFEYSSGRREYYSIVGPEYYTWSIFSEDPLIALTNKYLVDNVPVGTTWQAASTTIPIDLGLPTGPINGTVTVNSTIMNKDTTMTINGKTYSNVIRVKSVLSLSGLPIPVDINSNINSYYARKYGRIYDRSVISAQGSTLADTETKLLSTNF